VAGGLNHYKESEVMGYVQQVFFSRSIDNLTAIKTLGNLTGGSFTAGTSAAWTTGPATGSSVTFTSTTANSNVSNLSGTYSTAPSIVVTDGSAAVTESAAVTFRNLVAGQTLTMNGLIFSVGSGGATATQLASAFASIASGTSAEAINLTKTLGDAAGGTFTTGSATGWNTGAAATTRVVFTSNDINTNVFNLTSTVGEGSSAPIIVTTPFSGPVNETAVVTFQGLAARQTLTMEGLTFTAGANGATAAQVANAFASVSSGASYQSINLTKSLGDAAGGAFTAGNAAGWNAGTGSTSITFTSTTAATDVINLSSVLGVTPAAPLITVTEGSRAVTESASVTFNSITAGETINLAGVTFTAGVLGASSGQLANAFSNLTVDKTADNLNYSPLTMASAYVVTAGIQTNATSLSGYMVSPIDGKTYTFLAEGSFATTTATTNRTIASISGKITNFKLFLNGALVDTINYGAAIDDTIFGVTDFVGTGAQTITTTSQRAQAAYQFNYIASQIDKGATFIGSTASNSGADQVRGGAGNDFFTGNTGDDYFDGQGGVNTAIYRGIAANYNINRNITAADRADPASLNQVAAITVTDTVAGRDGSDTLVNVKRLQFADGIFALDTARGDNAGKAYRIYKAAFNRTPDTEGLGFWIASLDNGNSLNNVSQGFIGSPEFQRTYGANSSDTTFLTNVYTNVLGRNYDQSGYDFWLNGLKNGLQRDSLLSQFSESVENCANVAPLIGQGITYKGYVG
jgi:hypothetical protein